MAENKRTRCPRDSGWCDGTTCREIGFMHCPNAEPDTVSKPKIQILPLSGVALTFPAMNSAAQI